MILCFHHYIQLFLHPHFYKHSHFSRLLLLYPFLYKAYFDKIHSKMEPMTNSLVKGIRTLKATESRSSHKLHQPFAFFGCDTSKLFRKTCLCWANADCTPATINHELIIVVTGYSYYCRHSHITPGAQQQGPPGAHKQYENYYD